MPEFCFKLIKKNNYLNIFFYFSSKIFYNGKKYLKRKKKLYLLKKKKKVYLNLYLLNFFNSNMNLIYSKKKNQMIEKKTKSTF